MECSRQVPDGKRYHRRFCSFSGRPSGTTHERLEPIRSVMVLERTIRRYSGYFRGWCQAFGEHEQSFDEGNEINWLLADDQVGLILTDEVTRLFYTELLGDKKVIPTLRLSETYVELGDSNYPLKGQRDIEGMGALMALLRRDEPTCLYLSYHLLYPQGTRIVTFSKKTPQLILYKEMRSLRVVIF